jgi:predicted dehydrogenase
MLMKLAVIGLGSRGRGAYIRNLKRYKDVELAALCDINPAALEFTRNRYAPKAECYGSDDAFFAAGRHADWLIIATPDRLHYRHAMAALRLGYHIMLEKPVTDVPQEMDELTAFAAETGRTVIVCHVLRYSPFFAKIKDVIESGAIGEIVSVNHEENIGYWHFAHSYVRGNWHNTGIAAPLLLAKNSHDFDLLQWYIGKPCLRVSSFGSLRFFNGTHKPEGATAFCLGGCKVKDNCPYDAEKFYCRYASMLVWARGIVSGFPNPSNAQLRETLQTSDYGRCVFQSDNNINDHQVVSMEFEGGAVANLTVSAFSKSFYRRIHITGTEGELLGSDHSHRLTLNRFGKGSKRMLLLPTHVGHGGGDAGMAETLHKLMRGEHVPPGLLTTIDQTAKSHKIACAALLAEKEGRQVLLSELS